MARKEKDKRNQVRKRFVMVRIMIGKGKKRKGQGKTGKEQSCNGKDNERAGQ